MKGNPSNRKLAVPMFPALFGKVGSRLSWKLVPALLGALAFLAGCSAPPGEGKPGEETKAPAAGQVSEGPKEKSGAAVVPVSSGGETATTSSAGEKPPESAPAKKLVDISQLSEECQKVLAEIRRLASGVPMVFIGLKRSADEINQDMIRVTELSKDFLKRCAGTLADCEVRADLARMYLGRQRRYQEELEAEKLPKEEVQARLAARRLEIAELAKSVGALCEPGSDPWCTAYRILLEVHFSSGEYQETLDVGAVLRAKCDSAEIRSGVASNVAQALMIQGRYNEAVSYLQHLIQEHGDDPDYYLYNIRLFEALYGAARLEEVEDLMHLMRAEYPSLIDASPPGLARTQYEQWYHCQSVFWLGFVRMALGDMAEAEHLFTQNVSEIESLDAKLKSEGKVIDSVCPIIANFRSKHLIEFIHDYYGRKPEYDLDELLWATKEKFTFKEAIGKVVVIVTRRPGDARAQTFLQEVDRLVKARKSDGLLGLTLGFLVGAASDPQEDAMHVEKMRQDLAALNVTLPGGFDPDREGQRIVRGIFGTVGTASCTVINRRGQIAWWLADARDLDRNLVVRVVDRILKE